MREGVHTVMNDTPKVEDEAVVIRRHLVHPGDQLNSHFQPKLILLHADWDNCPHQRAIHDHTVTSKFHSSLKDLRFTDCFQT